MQILSHPLRISPSGVMTTMEDGSDAAVSEAIAALVETRLGERPMMPTLGIPDPAWLGLRPEDVNAAMAVYGPAGVTVTAVDAVTDDTGASTVTLQWERA